MITKEQARQLPGQELLDRDGDRIGEISRVFVDDTTAEPSWVTVKTGWFGLSESFVPLTGVQTMGRDLRAAYDSATIKEAPRFPKDEPLTQRDQEALGSHYGLSQAVTTDRVPDGRYRGTEGPVDAGAAVPDVSAIQARDAARPSNSVSDRSRHGRLGRFEGPFDRPEGSPGIAEARVCPHCGAYVAADLLDRHEDFHMTVGHPAGDYARHDVSVTGQT